MLKQFRKMSRWAAWMLLALAATLMFSLVGSTHPFKNSLRDLAQKRGIDFGTAVWVEPLSQDSTYRKVLAREFNMVTPENEMKFGPLHPERDRYDFTAADKLVDFAKEHDMEVRGHTLVWHESLPDWLTSREWAYEELMTILRGHIEQVVGHYKGQLVDWDVVNEAIADDKQALRDTMWLKVIGPEYIEKAFRWAHEVDPKARLFYNDYGGEEVGGKSDAIYEMVKDLLKQGVPIHGVGLQMHVNIKNPPNPEKVAANIKRLNDLGLAVQITEMDVRTWDATGTPKQKLAAQAEVYRNMMQVCLAAKNCNAFLLWGVSDRYSWVPRILKKADAPLIFDASYRAKPAYNVLKEVLKER
ncbi:MAG: endo-1,4-beta-xylanase [Cyanobacteriota bacterium]